MLVKTAVYYLGGKRQRSQLILDDLQQFEFPLDKTYLDNAEEYFDRVGKTSGKSETSYYAGLVAGQLAAMRRYSPVDLLQFGTRTLSGVRSVRPVGVCLIPYGQP